MKESKCFCYKERGHIAYDGPKKKKITAISEGVGKDSNYQVKEWLFSNLKKGAYLFFHHLCQTTYFVKIFLLFNIH